MRTRPPIAAIFCYAIAALLGLMGVLAVMAGIFGAGSKVTFEMVGVAIPSADTYLIGCGLFYVVTAGFLAAAGAVIHDIRRIAENTAPSVVAGRLAESMAAGRTSAPASAGPVVFYYFEKGVEHGPVSKAELAALIRSSQVNIFQRIETSIGGVRRPFEMRDLEG